MNRRFLAALIAVLSLMTCLAENNVVVWTEPSMDFGTDNGDGENNLALDLNEVKFSDSATTLYLTVRKVFNFNDEVRFSRNAYLLADGHKYPVLSDKDIVLNVFTGASDGYGLNLALRFKPLPRDVKSFDYINGEGDKAIKTLGIKAAEECWDTLFPSYWRNKKTGEWEIAFFDECAVYDCKFWNYKSRDIDSKSGKADFVLTNGDNEMKVSVGKNKNGHREIKIGSQKVLCSMITGHYLPFYQTVDTRIGFVDNGYKPDTVTVTGWLRNVPEDFKSDKTVRIINDDLFSDHYVDNRASIDDNGRFVARIPVINSTSFEILFYKNRSILNTVLEPGKDYFVLIDFKDGRRMWMGDDVRLQNELLRLPPKANNNIRIAGVDFDDKIFSINRELERHYSHVDSLCTEHPTLSTRYSIFNKDRVLFENAYDFSRSRSDVPNHRYPEEAFKFAYDTFWSKDIQPVTLQNYVRNFYKDFFDAYLLENKEAVPSQDYGSQKEFEDKITATLQYYAGLLDKLGARPIVKDIILYDYLRTKLENKSSELPYVGPDVIDTFSELVQTPLFINRAVAQNNRNIAVLNGDTGKLVATTDNSKETSEGKELVQKILEPFKGKFVLLDVWGTWCGPCLFRLGKSAEEYERLAKYDIAYVYLASRSPEDDWKKTIQKYKMSGSNVANYNLPAEQQAAVEKYLNVLVYPTYRLFDREGNLLDLDVDPLHLDNLDTVLGLLSGK